LTDTAYFLSDTHFKYHSISENETKKRRYFLDFLLSIEGASRLYLLGDIFDFWFEYRNVVPRHYHDILDGLYALHKGGTQIFMTGGNHDFWLGPYLSETLGFTILPSITTHTLQGRTITFTHGDTLLPGDHAYKTLKKIIRSRPVVALAHLVHPDILYGFAHGFSKASKGITKKKTEKSKNTLVNLAESSFFRWGNDVFVMGHVHFPCVECFGDRVFVILGDWEDHFSYLRLEESKLYLEYYRSREKTLIEKR